MLMVVEDVSYARRSEDLLAARYPHVGAVRPRL
jgi:hypothetical protein